MGREKLPRRTLLALILAVAVAVGVALGAPALSTAATRRTVTLHRCTIINSELGRQGIYPYRMSCAAATARIRKYVFGSHLPKGTRYVGEGDLYRHWYCYAFMGTGGCFKTRGSAYGTGAFFHQPHVLNEGAPMQSCTVNGCPATLTTAWPPPLAG